MLVNTAKRDSRSVETAEIESTVYGPKIAFTEHIDTNLNIIKHRIDDDKLRIDSLSVGDRVHTDVKIVYIEDVTDKKLVDTIKKRLNDLTVDDVLDSSLLVQMIEDNSWTIFPQFLITELPDRFSMSLLRGKIGILVDKSSMSIICPSSFLSFFESMEDLYMHWSMATFIRWVRIVFNVYFCHFNSCLCGCLNVSLRGNSASAINFFRTVKSKCPLSPRF
ncbi:spore germination protein [Bacillus carboniphilus]|uniref:Spore germination protein n=1 Tax=Bacillus carboniphilus TaxID=86663 RepID=A0ABY9JZN6_9BACI|nr:spore germination protein [Bacillus carboniphilus]WLR44243.1 spore germination protein [Bacillus carboniphilus]